MFYRRTQPILGLAIMVLSVIPALAAERPNVILIMVDDMGFSDIGCYGGEVQTPNLDRLAAEGMRFTQFYNNAKCTTTRASLLTGLYPRGTNLNKHLRYDMLTLGEAMQLSGYRTSLSGKWHLGRDPINHPFQRGFGQFYGLLDGCCNFFDPARRDPPYKGGRQRVFAQNDQRITEFPEDFYTTDAFTDHAIACMRAAQEAGQPFFAHITYTAPHYPLHAKPADVERYRGKFLMGWERMREQRWQRQQDMGLVSDAWRLSQGESRSYDWATANQEFEDLRMAVYAAMIDCVDQNIGRILATLDELDEDQNTLVMFLSDNGGCAEEPGGRDPQKRTPGPVDDYVAVGPAWGWAQNAPFRRYKSWLHEGGITTPFIAWWPGHVQAREINRQPAHIIDILPTLLELTGQDYPERYHEHELLPVEGKSLVSLFAKQERSPHDQLCWQWAGNRAIRQGDWKLVWDKLNRAKQWELYDLSQDRCELNDLAKKMPERVESMKRDWLTWAKKVELDVKKLP